jgi:hypothetical protein
MSATQTPITKEGLIELGFEEKDKGREYQLGNDSRISIYMGVAVDCHFAVLFDSEYQESVPLRNLKSIEQLKTIIEVCL